MKPEQRKDGQIEESILVDHWVFALLQPASLKFLRPSEHRLSNFWHIVWKMPGLIITRSLKPPSRR